MNKKQRAAVYFVRESSRILWGRSNLWSVPITRVVRDLAVMGF